MEEKLIITKVLEETEKRINDELKRINKDIKDFTNPVNSDNLKEKIDGRLSTDNLRKNYEKKSELEHQSSSLIEFKYTYFKEYEK